MRCSSCVLVNAGQAGDHDHQRNGDAQAAQASRTRTWEPTSTSGAGLGDAQRAACGLLARQRQRCAPRPGARSVDAGSASRFSFRAWRTLYARLMSSVFIVLFPWLAATSARVCVAREQCVFDASLRTTHRFSRLGHVHILPVTHEEGFPLTCRELSCFFDQAQGLRALVLVRTRFGGGRSCLGFV